MQVNLDALCTEIGEHLKTRGLAIFHGMPREFDEGTAVYWNTKSNRDYRAFIAAAETAGAKLMALFALEFDDAVVDGAIQRLHDSGLARSDQKPIEKRLNALRAYAGFTCQIELSFDLAPRVYVFELHTEWYDEMNDLIDEIEDAYELDDDLEDNDDASPHSGYFSKN